MKAPVAEAGDVDVKRRGVEPGRPQVHLDVPEDQRSEVGTAGLEHHSSLGGDPPAEHAVELHAEKLGGAGSIWVGKVDEDDVEGADVVADERERVLRDHLDPWVGEARSVQRGESSIGSSQRDHLRIKFHHGDGFDIGVPKHLA